MKHTKTQTKQAKEITLLKRDELKNKIRKMITDDYKKLEEMDESYEQVDMGLYQRIRGGINRLEWIERYYLGDDSPFIFYSEED